MKVFVIGEHLPDQRRTNDLAVFFDQAALGLIREDYAGNPCHGQRIEKSRDQRQRDDKDDGGTNFLQHD